jgi:GNAT superfamily N-acetyltransferase
VAARTNEEVRTNHVTTALVLTRSATQSDAPRLAQLSDALGYAVDPAIMAERLKRLLERAEDRIFVAQTEARVVGWIHCAEQELLEAGQRCEILGLIVDQAYRSQGVGRVLVSAAEHWALSRGLRQMSVRSNVVRAESHPFYERLGYVRAKTQHAYQKMLSPG